MAQEPMAPPAQEGAPPAEGGGGGGDLGDLAQNVGKGLQLVLQYVAEIPEVDNGKKQALAKVLSDYQNVIVSIVQGGSPEGEEPADAGNVPMESGGGRCRQELNNLWPILIQRLRPTRV